jgi:hypothetical protein
MDAQEEIKKAQEGELHHIAPSTKCSHSFVQRAGTEALCRKCNVGYVLSPGMTVENEHIYYLDELVV